MSEWQHDHHGCVAEDQTAELALGLLSGPQRAAAILHVEHCPNCRMLTAELAGVIDDLLVGGPAIEPPAGFESAVLARIEAATAAAARPVAPFDPPRPRQAHRRRLLLAAAALLLVAAAASVGVAVGRHTSAPPVERAARTISAAMVTPTGWAVGKVELGANPSTLMIAMPAWYSPTAERTYSLEVALTDGTRHTFDKVALHNGGAWSTMIDFDTAAVRNVTMRGSDGEVLCRAELSR